MHGSTLILTSLITAIVLPIYGAGFNDTDNYYKCPGRIGGTWILGQAPSACDGTPFGDEQFAFKQFGPVIFDLNSAPSQETYRYANEIHALLSEVAPLYLEFRSETRPTVVQAFTHALLAVAYQESYWSHYRISDDDSPLKLMRGDYGHGHGLMQVDDRWHYLAVEKGLGWDIIQNISYSLDEYYRAWIRAPQQSCVNAQNWQEIAQAAYSAYNGGPSKICRFKNPNDRWARNDIGFLEKWQSLPWEKHLAPTPIQSSIDIRCHLSHETPCFDADRTDNNNHTHPQLNTIYEWSSPELMSCTHTKNGWHCMLGHRNNQCLAVLDSQPFKTMNAPNTLSPPTSTQPPQQQAKVMQVSSSILCDQLFSDQSANIGQYILLNKNINLRKSPGGEWIATLVKGQVLQVVDRFIDNELPSSMYYGVITNGQKGFLYSGNTTTHNQWAQVHPSPTKPHPTTSPLPSVGQIWMPNRQIAITTLSGHRVLIPQLTPLRIIGITILDPLNTIVLQTDRGQLLYGSTYPDIDLRSDLIPFEAPPTFQLKAKQSYVMLKKCPSESCEQTGEYATGPAMEQMCQKWGCSFKTDSLQQISHEGDWSKVKVIRSQSTGWIHSQLIEEVQHAL